MCETLFQKMGRCDGRRGLLKLLAMEIKVDDYEKLGAFYLGRDYDPEAGALLDELTLYDSRDLVTHGVVLGMTGSGKTGLCMALLEEAAMDGVPAVVIDPKGDIANLMLTFPELSAEEFRPWMAPEDAQKKGLSQDELAERTAETWRKGLADWGQGADRVEKLRSQVEINVFTPGSEAGIPVSVLSSLEVPPFEVMDDGAALAERIESTVNSLLTLVGEKEVDAQGSEAVFLSTLFQTCWRRDEGLDLKSLIRYIQKPPFDTIGVLDLDSILSATARGKLAVRFNNVLASPGFQTWLKGPPLDIETMLHTETGKPRISVFSIAHLSDEQRMFFVSLLLNQMVGWMRTQSGTQSLRALLYMDEIYGFLPPIGNPASKVPLMTILKQGRAFGLGALLATQNPVDLDYKALSNIGTWWLGRLQTEQDQARVMDGLDSAAGSEGLDRGEMEKLLAGLKSRVFLMHNVHDDGPVMFHVRWVMSYLRGPLTRRQIKTLMDPLRDRFLGKTSDVSRNPMVQVAQTEKRGRPAVGSGVDEFFEQMEGEAEEVVYCPALLQEAKVTFRHRKSGMEGSRIVREVRPMNERGLSRDETLDISTPLKALDREPEEGIGFAELPGFAMNQKNYSEASKAFVGELYRTARLELMFSQDFGAYSQFGESEGDFRARLGLRARELRDEAVDELRKKFASKLATKERMILRAENRVEREQDQASAATMQAAGSVFGSLLSGLFGGRKRRLSMRSATRAVQQRRDVGRAEKVAEALRDELADLEAELQDEIEEVSAGYDPLLTELEKVEVKPYKKDIKLAACGLLWVPEQR